MKIYDRKRRSGKTTSLIDQVEWVNIFYDVKKIWVVIPNWATKMHIKQKLSQSNNLHDNIKFCTWLGHVEHSSEPDFIFVDEYTHCNNDLINYITRRYPDRTIMWGTPR